jgi:hypothetical protein
MTKSLPFLVLVAAVSSSAHHGYGDYDKGKAVRLEGTVQQVLWANPHVIITLLTADSREYRVEWGSVLQLSGTGVKAIPVKEGDDVVVVGSINRNPEKHILTLVRELSRPADGWRWVNPRYTSSN